MKKLLFAVNDIFLQRGLHAAFTYHFELDFVSTLTALEEKIGTENYDLVILEDSLEQVSTLEIISELQSSNFQTKILVLAHSTQVDSRIRALETGADDCLSKPVSLAELKIKIRKLLAIDKLLRDECIVLGKLTFYPDSGHLIMYGTDIWLRKREAEILHCLLRYRNQVVTREKIIDTVWSGNQLLPVQTTLDVYIRRLRVLLREHSALITTIRGFGYRLNDSLVRTP